MSIVIVEKPKRKKSKPIMHRYIATLLLCSFALQGHAATSAEIAGNPEGNVTLVEFMDYGCPHCRAMAPIIDQLLINNQKLRVVYRVAPLLGENSVFLDRIMIAAQSMSGYAKFKQLVTTTTSPLTPNALMAMASESGINPEVLWTQSQNPDVSKALNENQSLYNALGQDGIPLILIGNANQVSPQAVFEGEQSYPTLQGAINLTTTKQPKENIHATVQ